MQCVTCVVKIAAICRNFLFVGTSYNDKKLGIAWGSITFVYFLQRLIAQNGLAYLFVHFYHNLFFKLEQAFCVAFSLFLSDISLTIIRNCGIIKQYTALRQNRRGLRLPYKFAWGCVCEQRDNRCYNHI